MHLNRRAFISLLMSSAAAHTLDIDKLLWIPGQKTIFLPSKSIHRLTESQIIALEIERLTPRIKELFERDDVFYTTLRSRTMINGLGDIRVPLQFGVIDGVK
jgi:hypothetical protein